MVATISVSVALTTGMATPPSLTTGSGEAPKFWPVMKSVVSNSSAPAAVMTGAGGAATAAEATMTQATTARQTTNAALISAGLLGRSGLGEADSKTGSRTEQESPGSRASRLLGLHDDARSEQALDLRFRHARCAQHLHRVLADLRRHGGRPLVLPAHLDRARHGEARARALVVDRHQRAARAHLLVAGDVVEGAHHAARDAGCFQDASPLWPVTRGEHLVEDRGELACVGAPAR